MFLFLTDRDTARFFQTSFQPNKQQYQTERLAGQFYCPKEVIIPLEAIGIIPLKELTQGDDLWGTFIKTCWLARLMEVGGCAVRNKNTKHTAISGNQLLTKVQWYLGIRPLWNKSNLVYVLFGREQFCLIYDLCLEYDSRARTCLSQNES
jgi:hypothetical protein